MRLRYPILSLLVLSGGLLLGWSTLRVTDLPERDVMEKSFWRMQRAEESLKAYARHHEIALEAEDREGTYLLGPELSPLVTTMGYPEIKRTTVSPDGAALMARLFTEAGLHAGDVVGVGSSGSFPGYLLATLCASEEMGLKVRLIASLGSSMYGATRTEFSILTLLSCLQEQGFHFEVVAVSPGGAGDQGEGAFEGLAYDGTRLLSRSLLQASGFPVLEEADLEANVQKRKALLGPISCFVNIGGAEPNVGEGAEILDLAPGLVFPNRSLPRTGRNGLVFSYLAQGIPVIHVLQIRQLSARYGIAIDPHPLPRVPAGALYQSRKGPVWIPLASLLLAVGILVWGKREERAKRMHDAS